MRSARAVAVAVGLAAACGLPPGWDEVEDAEDEVEEPWMTLLNQCSTLAWAWYGVEEAIRPWRRSEPSSSEADEVSARGVETGQRSASQRKKERKKQRLEDGEQQDMNRQKERKKEQKNTTK